MSAVTNQRSEARYTCFVPVEGKQGSEFDTTKTLDISRHGIGLISSQPVEINQKIALEIVLKPNTEPVMVIGIVKWVRKIGEEAQSRWRVGLVFSEVVSGSSTRLDKYLVSKRWENNL